MSLCFVDTNILIYTRDPKSPKKAATAREWVGRLADAGAIVVSAQVMNEFAQNVLWKLPDIPFDSLSADIEIMSAWRPMVMTSETTRSALALHRRYGYTIYDSANVVMAIEAGCRAFVSEDLQNRQTIAGTTILNPFEADLAELDALLRA